MSGGYLEMKWASTSTAAEIVTDLRFVDPQPVQKAPVGKAAAPRTSPSPSGAAQEKTMSHKPLAVLFFLALVGAACSGGGNDSVADDLNGATPSTPSTALADPAPTSAPTTELTSALPAAEGAGDAWVAMWDGAEGLVTDQTVARTEIDAVATAEVADQLETIFSPEVAGDVEIAARTFENRPVLTDIGNGMVEIDDCLQVTPPDTAPFVWFAGTATAEDGSWRITSIEPKALGGCVPAEIAEAAIAGYEAYWDARVEFWEPADPNHPLVEQT
ncbi:MAG: hypothetical protein ACFCVK_24290, partial [Acidimicrobiales bacterium]